MKLKDQTYVVTAVISLLFAAHTSAKADAVADWNAITVSTVAVPPGRPGPSAVIDYAIVHGAVYDAVQAIERDYEPYCADIPGATGSPDAAVAAAAYYVLVNRFPAQAGSLQTTFQNYLDDNDISILDAGLQVGAAAADCMIALRVNDGSFPATFPEFRGADEIGIWRSFPPGPPMAAAWLGSVTPFTMRSPSQFRALPPPALNSPEYTRDHNEVKALGALNGSERTTEQTELALFWNLNYPVVFSRTLREVSNAHVDNISDSSRLFALTTMAMADSIITSWETKMHYVSWRPVTAIREGDNDSNPRTVGDGAWTPLVATPPYPDHSSGANNLAAAATRSMQLFFGTNEMTFDVTTTNVLVPEDKRTNTYHKFMDPRGEVVDARIYQGIHFRFADEAARKQGEHIAQWAWGHFFRPLDD